MARFLTQFRSLVRNADVKHTAVLISGLGTAQALLVLTTPIISRLYDPASFGTYGLFMGVSSVIGVVVAFRYELAIVLPKGEDEARGVAVVALLGTLLVTACVVLMVALWKEKIVSVLGAGGTSGWLWWLPVSLLFTGLWQVGTYWCVRQGRFGLVSKVQVFRALGMIIIQLANGVRGLGSAGLVSGWVAGQGIAGCLLGRQVFQGSSRSLVRPPKPQALTRLARSYVDFPLFSAPQGLVAAVSQYLPAFILAGFFGATAVGLFTMAEKALHLPIQLAGQAVQQVFLRRASERSTSAANLSRLYRKVTLGLLGMGSIPFGLVMAFGPYLFSVILGSQWRIAGQYGQWLSIWLLTQFAMAPTAAVLIVVRKQRFLLLQNVLGLVAKVVALLLGVLVRSDVTSVAAFSLAGCVFSIALIAITWVRLKVWGERAQLRNGEEGGVA